MPTKKKNIKSLRQILEESIQHDKENYDIKYEDRKPLVIGYCRVSTNIQVETGISLDTQRRNIEQFAYFKNCGVKMFSDDGISGASYDNRPGLLSALKELRKGDFSLDLFISKILPR